MVNIDLRRKHFVLFCAMVSCFSLCSAQVGTYDSGAPPNTYRSKENPVYWKNRPPDPAYWQQDVYYVIDAAVDERTGIISGDETLTYWNNSPDTLSFVYFHLYQQAFVKGGHLENLNRNNNVKQTFGKYEAAGLGEKMESIQSSGRELHTEADFSVVKVYLLNSLLPGDSVDFKIKFKTYFDKGSQRRRMKRFDSKGFTHFDGVHWYPRICVYDRKSGWDTDQHLGKEFYGDFGTYDVKLTFSSNYIVGATGTLQNEEEVLPADLRQKLDIRNFATKPWESAPSVIIPYDSSQHKTWHYYAENVHDFAWTADPTYRIGEAKATIWDPYLKKQRTVMCQAFAQETHAAGWLDAALFTSRVIEVNSADYGAYQWPKIIVADARDGMEYPMLTLDGGYSPVYYDLLAHEISHMWFFGQVGNNETYRAALDEGFTQFVESWALLKIIGDTMPRPHYKSKYYDHFKKSNLVLDEEVYVGYLQEAARGIDESINQHSDAFNGALGHGGGYRHVYYKTATMLWNLQYVMGDSLFQDAMKHYFNQWKFCHPYFEDFRNSIIQYSHADLNWFFDEWMETTKTIDYGVGKIKKTSASAVSSQTSSVNGSDNYDIRFVRRGRSQMPLDFSVLAKNGMRYNFYVPNTWFKKETTATVLPKWYGWDKLHPEYHAIVNIPSGIREVTIDPSLRLADVYMLNNDSKCQAKWNFDSQVENIADWKRYQFYWRPDLWYNAIDGLKIGMHVDGNYFNLKNKFSLTAWYNSKLFQNGIPSYSLSDEVLDKPSPLSFNFTYSSNTHRFIRNSSVDITAKYLDGLWGGSAGFSIRANAKNTISFGVKSMYRANENELQYLLYPDGWNAASWNNSASMAIDHTYQYFHGTGDIDLRLRSASLFSDYKYSDLTMTAINKNNVGKLEINTRVTGRIGTGDAAPESALYLAGSSLEEMMDNKFIRSKAFIPDEWLGYGNVTNHFQDGGGLNLRGYAGYLVAQENKDGNIYIIYKGNSGTAVNAEFEFDKFIKLHPGLFKNWLHFDTYVFTDAGTMGYKNEAGDFFLSAIRADAGLGIALTVKSWGPLDKVQPFTLRADFPLLINRVPSDDPHYFDFRWVIGVGRAF